MNFNQAIINISNDDFPEVFSAMHIIKPRIALTTAIIGASFVGLSGIFVRLSEVGPITTGFFRFFFAIPLLWSWMMFDNSKTLSPRVPTTLKDYLLILIASAFFALDICIWNISLTLTSVVNSTLLNNMTPIFVTFFAWFILKERLTLFMILGIFLALMGTFILMGSSFSLAMHSFYGDLMGLLSAVFYAGYIVISKRLRNSFPPSTLMAWTSLFTLYFISIFIFLDSGSVIPITFKGWSVLIGSSLIVHVLGQGLMSYSIGHLTAGFTSIIMMIGPLMASIMAWFIFDETLTPIQFLGAIVILSGIIVAHKSFKGKITDMKEPINFT